MAQTCDSEVLGGKPVMVGSGEHVKVIREVHTGRVRLLIETKNTEKPLFAWVDVFELEEI